MGKKKAAKKTVAKKRATKKAPKRAAKKAAPRVLNTHGMATALERANTIDGTGGEPVGCCAIRHPGSPDVQCYNFTEQQCRDIHGEWSSEPCR